MNGNVNCILAVCCDPLTDAPRDELAKEMAQGLDLNANEAKKCASWVLKHFDLAEKGTLQPFKDSIAKLARENR